MSNSYGLSFSLSMLIEYALGSYNQDRDGKATANSPTVNGQSRLYMAGKSTARWINAWKKKLHGQRSSFKYTAIEMDECTTGAPSRKLSGEELSASAASLTSFEGDEPTEEERQTLRKVADRMPWPAFLVAIVELCERFTYYGLSGPFQNYIQNSYHDPNGLPGAIGMIKCFIGHHTQILIPPRPRRDRRDKLDRLLSILVLCHANFRRHRFRPVSRQI